MTFQQTIKNKLGLYRNRKFPNHQAGFWKTTNGNITQQHILQLKHRDLNLLDPYRSDFLLSQFPKPKGFYHRYFHHLNSSQAMCLNFFFPLFKENKLEWVLEFLGIQDEFVRYDKVEFEKKSSLDRSDFGEPTNFDFYFETESGLKFYFEIKYTESEFGSAKNDDRHINKFNAVYKKHISKLNPNHQKMDSFFRNYQIGRNLIHIDERTYVVFVFPSENTKISDQSNRARNEILSPEWLNQLKLVTWEDLVMGIENRTTNSKLHLQWKEFREKYL
jgi:hypothetical protein